MRVYQFNRRIYRGNLEREFYLFCLLRQPGLLRHLPRQLRFALRYLLGSLSQTGLWEAFYRYLESVEDLDARLGAFWSRRRLRRFKKDFLIRRRAGDVILSAAPECLLAPLGQYLGMQHIIGSIVDAKSGHYTGLSCRGAEQLRRLRQRFPEGDVEMP